ncbi:peptidoglycan-binding protein [Streptomyces sp. YIM 98790]|uniref:peptidoglycan-binding domain-containing protein n=1 Tax=Streptomyces sp. YIM 98790 TaxID=2689077 RepID=UPI00140B9203|nr:peptidoglycan-binding domain-containing protein [Streptomyces sp. YIM 98790]
MKLRSVLTALAAGAGMLLVAPGAQAAPLSTQATVCNGNSYFGLADTFYYKPTRGFDTQNTSCTLRRGDRGDGVMHLQYTMWKCYGQDIARDGIFGPDTENAVKNVQRFHNHFGAGLAVDGIYGPRTGSTMTWEKYWDGTWESAGCW